MKKKDLDLRLYVFEQDTFDAKLEEHHMLYRYEIPISTSVVGLIQRITADMQASPSHYVFAPDTRPAVLPHEALSLHLLQFVNRGMPRGQDGQVRLRRSPYGSNTTIEVLASDARRYCIPLVSIDANYFIIHFGACSYISYQRLSDQVSQFDSCPAFSAYSYNCLFPGR
jgi:hypothetical protein